MSPGSVYFARDRSFARARLCFAARARADPSSLTGARAALKAVTGDGTVLSVSRAPYEVGAFANLS